MSRLEPRRYSERLGVIDPDQLFAMAEAFELGEVLGAEPAVGGLFGQNLMLTTSEGEFVLRGNPHGHVQLTKERRVARFINDFASLPAPWPYRICEDAELFGWTYAIMPRLSGGSGTELWEAADDYDKIELAAATGEALAWLQDGEADFFGPYDAQLDDFIAMDNYLEWFLHRLEHSRKACRAVNALSAEADLFIDELIEENSAALKEPFTPVLVHHDFKPHNLNFVETESGGHEASGVFDLGEAYLGDGEEDLVRTLWLVESGEARAAFMETYTKSYPLRDGAPQRLTLYALADWLVVWEYGRRLGTWFEDTTFMTAVQPILERARAIAEAVAEGS